MNLKVKASNSHQTTSTIAYNHDWDQPNPRIRDYSHVIRQDIIIINIKTQTL